MTGFFRSKNVIFSLLKLTYQLVRRMSAVGHMSVVAASQIGCLKITQVRTRSAA
jgi:hypothetical protein